MLRTNSIISFVPLIKEKNTKTIIEEIKLEISKNIPELSINVGLGNYYSKINDLKKSFQEAEQALKISKAINVKNSIHDYSEIGIYKVLFEVKDFQKLQSFFNETLGRLDEYDQNHGTELIHTLEVYLNENCNITKASEKLYIHRNTLKYRLSKIKKILKCNLNDPYDRLNLQVGLVVKKFLDLQCISKN